MTAVRVSIVIAAYDAEATLGAQLDALRPQLGDDTEVLVCDNGSTDGTRRLVETYAAGAMRVRLVDASARRGPAAARNIGASAASGTLLLFCDADDVVTPGWAAGLRTALQSADLVAGRLDGRSLNRGNRASVSWEVSAEIRMPFWTRFGAGASSNLGIRRAVFESVGGFDERLRTGEDVDLCWRVQLAGFTFARSPGAVVLSRQRNGRRAVFRQAYAYGAGSRALQIKYRRHIDADRGRSFATAHDEAGSPAGRDPLPSRLPRVLRPLTRSGQANVAWRLGEALGKRYGAIDPGVSALPLP